MRINFFLIRVCAGRFNRNCNSGGVGVCCGVAGDTAPFPFEIGAAELPFVLGADATATVGATGSV